MSSFPPDEELLRTGTAVRFMHPSDELLEVVLNRDATSVVIAATLPDQLFFYLPPAPLRRTLLGGTPHAVEAFLFKLRRVLEDSAACASASTVLAIPFQLSGFDRGLPAAIAAVDTLRLVHTIVSPLRGSEQFLIAFADKRTPAVWPHQVIVAAAHKACGLGIALLHVEPESGIVQRVLLEYHPTVGAVVEIADSTSARLHAERTALRVSAAATAAKALKVPRRGVPEVVTGLQWWLELSRATATTATATATATLNIPALEKALAHLRQDHIADIVSLGDATHAILIMYPSNNHTTTLRAIAAVLKPLDVTCRYPALQDTPPKGSLPLIPLQVNDPSALAVGASEGDEAALSRRCANAKCKCLVCECLNCACDDEEAKKPLTIDTHTTSATTAAATNADAKTKTATVDGNATATSADTTTKVRVGGHFQLSVLGMSCASCAVRVEGTLRKHPNVLSAVVNFATSSASVTTTSDVTDPQPLIAVIEDLGYKSGVQESGSSETRDALAKVTEIADLQWRVIIAAVFAVPLIVMMFVRMQLKHEMGPVMEPFYGELAWEMLIDWALATPVLIIGRAFFVRAAKAARHCAYTMDTLVAFGVGGAYLFSIVVVILAIVGVQQLQTYFEAAGALMAFMLLGKYLEARAKKETGSAIIKLMDLAPRTAILVTSEHGEVEVPSSSINVGDIVRVLPGGHVPVDGTVIQGTSAVDEQLMTGESVPQEKGPGDTVIGGTLCTNADLLIRADRVGEDTALFRILKIVREAQNSKPAIQRVADRIAGVFVPCVILYSFAVLAVWLILGYAGAYPEEWRGDHSPLIFAFTFFLASMVVACPCALGLATPTAIMVGTGTGALHGILIKSGQTLEHAKRVNCVLFDKTGTLTKGKLEVVATHFFPPAAAAATAASDATAFDEHTLKLLIGTVEGRSMHPVAKAITATFGTLPESQVPDLTVENLPGSGLSATFTTTAGAAVTMFVGRPTHLAKLQIDLPAAVESLVDAAQREGATVIIATLNAEVRAMVALADTPKEDARAVVLALQAQSMDVRMVSGDNIHAARHIAALVGIPPTHVHAEVRPANKAEVVGLHQAEGRVVCFVGDGLNDSPALSQADVGVALGAGTEVAIESADAVLVRNALVDLLGLLSLSRATVRRIYFNFVLACVYNLAALPLASGIFYPAWQQQVPPVVAGAAMVCSSLSVLVSSLMLRLHRPPTVGADAVDTTATTTNSTNAAASATSASVPYG